MIVRTQSRIYIMAKIVIIQNTHFMQLITSGHKKNSRNAILANAAQPKKHYPSIELDTKTKTQN